MFETLYSLAPLTGQISNRMIDDFLDICNLQVHMD